jgi:BNR/Asp-box repeat.
MNRIPVCESGFFNPRVFVAFSLGAFGALLGLLSFAANPPTGTITVASPPLTWVGTASGTGDVNGESTCVEGVTCDTFTLTVDPTSNWAGKRIEVRIQQAASYDDTDLVIHKGDNSGPIIATSGNGAGSTEVGYINPATDGTGVFSVHVIYFATVAGDQYHGSAEVVPLTPAAPPAAVIDTTNKIGYENFGAPGVITPVTLTTGPTVEWLGRSAGEPSIGVNWKSLNSANGITNFQSDLESLFVNFSDNPANGGGATAAWANRPGPTQVVIDSDPIGFTDVQTGRVFAAELTATSPTCKISFTDNDGQVWAPTSGPLGSGIDHETIGGGRYHAPLVGTLPYPNAVYYCSQDLVAAFCLRSDDGGVTWGPPIQTYTTQCGGLHGHVKVSPADGTVYLPNKDCTGNEAVVVSEDNGITWNVRPVSNATVQPGSSQSDPAMAVDASGRAYFAMAANDSTATVAYSDDHGVTWQNIVNVSSALGLQNIRYPAATAGDAGRAAVAFLGSTTAGDANSSTFNGIWHLYVSHTFDGGLTWTTTDTTPNMPIQRGNIWTGGGANIGRNLLDFIDVAIDKQGRVQVGYANGCAGGNCAQSSPTATGNAYTATATIARQSSGKRMLAASDAVSQSKTPPGMPFVTQRRVGSVVHLAWSEADPGASAVRTYQILRGTSSGGETLLATVNAPQTKYDDLTATDTTKTYYYKVVAANRIGSSAPNNEIAAPYVGDTCTGILIHQNDPTHPEAAGAGAGQVPQLLIDYVTVAEPYLNGASEFVFKMKVTDLSTLPPNSRWRMVWDSFASPGQQVYVGMTTDSSSTPSFEYGTIATAVVGLVLGVPQETKVGAADQPSSYNPDGTITIYVPKAAVGNPRPGDLLGAVNGRTFADNTAFERSTQLIDHTFVKAQTDNAFPAATYTVAGNNVCAPAPSPTPTPTPKPKHSPHG